MRIGLIGWYGHDNAGDERMLYCLRRLFDGDELLVTRDLDDAVRHLEELNACDYVLFGGGGLVLRGFGRFAPLFEQLTPPFGCIGLGVEATHRDNRALIDVLKRKAEFILVRDTISRDRMDCHYKVIVGPDLTFLYPYDVAEWPGQDRCSVNFRPWPYWHFQHGGLASRLMAALDRRVPWLERLYPLRKWDPSQVARVLRERCDEVVPVPLYTESGCVDDRQILDRYFPTTDAMFAPEQLAECRYLVAMRLHALIFACQMGIPFVSLSYQPKNHAFCRDIGLEEFSVDPYDVQRFERTVTSMKERAHDVHEHLLEVRHQKVRDVRKIVEPIVRLVRRQRTRS